MNTAIGRTLGATLALVALAAGSAAAADGQQSRQLEMEVVEVVEKFRPAPVNGDEYFSPLAAELSAAVSEAVQTRLAASAMVGYQLLSAELELNQGTRVAADDTQAGRDSDTEVASL